jgi:hypothetical protein
MNNLPSIPPRPTPRCATFQPRLALLRTDALASAVAAHVAEHVAGCPWCRREVATYDALDAAARGIFADDRSALHSLWRTSCATSDLSLMRPCPSPRAPAYRRRCGSACRCSVPSPLCSWSRYWPARSSRRMASAAPSSAGQPRLQQRGRRPVDRRRPAG